MASGTPLIAVFVMSYIYCVHVCVQLYTESVFNLAISQIIPAKNAVRFSMIRLLDKIASISFKIESQEIEKNLITQNHIRLFTGIITASPTL